LRRASATAPSHWLWASPRRFKRRKYSYAAGAFVAGLAVVEGFIHLTHAHSHAPPTMYPFRKIRNKAFPFGDGQSSLFGAAIDDVE